MSYDDVFKLAKGDGNNELPIEEWDELGKHFKLWEKEIGHGWRTKFEYVCQLRTRKGKIFEAKGGTPDEAVDNALDMNIADLLI